MNERLQSIQKFEKYLNHWAPGSWTTIDYVSAIRRFAASCSKPWREVTIQDIDAFIEQQRQVGLSAATIKRRVYALKVFFDFLVEESGDLSWSNPVRLKRHTTKPSKRLPHDLTNEQVAQLWAVIINPRDRAWFALMLRSGLQTTEVIELTLNSLLNPATPDQPARLRVKGKEQKERVVLLTVDAYAALQAWLAVRPASEQAAIFLNRRGQPLSANGIGWLLRRYSQTAGLKATSRQIRHTFVRQLIEGGLSLTNLEQLA